MSYEVANIRGCTEAFYLLLVCVVFLVVFYLIENCLFLKGLKETFYCFFKQVLNGVLDAKEDVKDEEAHLGDRRVLWVVW